MGACGWHGAIQLITSERPGLYLIKCCTSTTFYWFLLWLVISEGVCSGGGASTCYTPRIGYPIEHIVSVYLASLAYFCFFSYSFPVLDDAFWVTLGALVGGPGASPKGLLFPGLCFTYSPFLIVCNGLEIIDHSLFIFCACYVWGVTHSLWQSLDECYMWCISLPPLFSGAVTISLIVSGYF